MKTKLLQSLRERWEELYEDNKYDFTTTIAFRKYITFTDQPLKLEQFVPCDDEGNVLEKPESFEYLFSIRNQPLSKYMRDLIDEAEQYQQALERVIFDGFEVVESTFKTIRTGGRYKRIINSSVSVFYYNYTSKKWCTVYDYKTLADLSGKVYLNSNGIKESGL